jgi:hypothetical protein
MSNNFNIIFTSIVMPTVFIVLVFTSETSDSDDTFLICSTLWAVTGVIMGFIDRNFVK